MTQYIIRRLLYALPLLLGVNILTFVLFFIVNSPDDMARMQLGQKHVTEQAVQNWKQQRGYDLPLIWNETEQGGDQLTETIFFQKSMGLFLFNFGLSDSGRNIGADIKQRMWPRISNGGSGRDSRKLSLELNSKETGEMACFYIATA